MSRYRATVRKVNAGTGKIWLPGPEYHRATLVPCHQHATVAPEAQLKRAKRLWGRRYVAAGAGHPAPPD